MWQRQRFPWEPGCGRACWHSASTDTHPSPDRPQAWEPHTHSRPHLACTLRARDGVSHQMCYGHRRRQSVWGPDSRCGTKLRCPCGRGGADAGPWAALGGPRTSRQLQPDVTQAFWGRSWTEDTRPPPSPPTALLTLVTGAPRGAQQHHPPPLDCPGPSEGAFWVRWVWGRGCLLPICHPSTSPAWSPHLSSACSQPPLAHEKAVRVLGPPGPHSPVPPRLPCSLLGHKDVVLLGGVLLPV